VPVRATTRYRRVRSSYQLIVGATHEKRAANDKQQMVPPGRGDRETASGEKTGRSLTDNGIARMKSEVLAGKGTARIRSDGKRKARGAEKALPARPSPREASRVERMERKLETKVEAAVYATRKFIVEARLRGRSNRARGVPSSFSSWD